MNEMVMKAENIQIFEAAHPFSLTCERARIGEIMRESIPPGFELSVCVDNKSGAVNQRPRRDCWLKDQRYRKCNFILHQGKKMARAVVPAQENADCQAVQRRLITNKTQATWREITEDINCSDKIKGQHTVSADFTTGLVIATSPDSLKTWLKSC